MKCSRCGYENSPDADRCTACDAHLPAPPPPRPEIVPREHPIRPQRSLERLAEPAPPIVHVPLPPETGYTMQDAGGRILHRASGILGIRPTLVGRVVGREARWDALPREPARFILRLAILLLALPVVLGACSLATLALVTAALAVICLGMQGLLLCTVPALSLLLALWGLARRPTPDEVPVLDLRVEDASMTPPRLVNVELIGARQGGDVEIGDEVEVWGRWTRGGTLRAWRVRLVAADDRPIRAEIRAARPYSLPVALAALLVAVLVNVALAWLLWPRG